MFQAGFVSGAAGPGPVSSATCANAEPRKKREIRGRSSAYSRSICRMRRTRSDRSNVVLKVLNKRSNSEDDQAPRLPPSQRVAADGIWAVARFPIAGSPELVVLVNMVAYVARTWLS